MGCRGESMKLYVAIAGWDYEGYDIIGVFDSKEKAQVGIDLVKLEGRYVDYYDILEYELNKNKEQTK